MNDFKAGALLNHLTYWKKFTSDFEVLETVSGCPIYFEQQPDLSASYNSHKRFSSQEHKFIENELKTLLKKGAIKESSHELGEIISPIFLTPKSDGSFRLILNLKRLNKCMPYTNFKMDTIVSVLKLVTKIVICLK